MSADLDKVIDKQKEVNFLYALESLKDASYNLLCKFEDLPPRSKLHDIAAIESNPFVVSFDEWVCNLDTYVDEVQRLYKEEKETGD